MPTRVLDRSEVDLAVEACRLAAEDAGLAPSEIDGINVQVHHYPPPDIPAIAQGLGMTDVRWSREGGNGIVAAGQATQAMDAGHCEVTVVCKIMNTIAPSSMPRIAPGDGGVEGPEQFTVPYGLGYARQMIGLMGRRFMHERGYRPEQLAWIPIVERQHAILNPLAYMKQPLGMEEYLASRYIAEPVRLLDCDIPVNRALAYIITSEDRARGTRRPGVYLKGWAGDRVDRGFDPWDGTSPSAATLYRDTGLGPEEMDLWFAYDGFSFLALMWLENLGLVRPGEAGAYVEGGARIRFDGDHPVNTHGGNLSEGRSQGAGAILEAVRQLRGEAGGRQARRAQHVVISNGMPYPHGGECGVIGLD